MEIFDMDKLNISSEIFRTFLNKLQEKIKDKNFLDNFNKIKEIDKRHFVKELDVKKMQEIIEEYKEKEIINIKNIKTLQIILEGNPELVFRLVIEAFRNNVRMVMNINDFCLAQNKFISQVINDITTEMKYSKIIELNNLASLNQEKINASKVDMTICVGNSNEYNILSDEITNIRLYPYGIFELYSDSEDLEEVRRMLYDYTEMNRFEMEILDDLSFEDVIEDINENGYGFCSILLSKNKNNMHLFKEKIKSKYIFVNENPFGKIKFDFDLKKIIE